MPNLVFYPSRPFNNSIHIIVVQLPILKIGSLTVRAVDIVWLMRVNGWVGPQYKSAFVSNEGGKKDYELRLHSKIIIEKEYKSLILVF